MPPSVLDGGYEGSVPKRSKSSENREAHRDVNRSVEAIDKLLDNAVAKILFWRPMELTRIRPKLDCSLLPVRVGIKHNQGSRPIAYILPSGSKKLKDELPKNVRVAKELHPKKGTGTVRVNEIEIAFEGVSRSSLKSRKPKTSQRGNSVRKPQLLSGVNSEKRLTAVAIVFDSGLHESKGRKKGRISRTK